MQQKFSDSSKRHVIITIGCEAIGTKNCISVSSHDVARETLKDVENDVGDGDSRKSANGLSHFTDDGNRRWIACGVGVEDDGEEVQTVRIATLAILADLL